MARFDCFGFLQGRQLSLIPTDQQLADFEIYSTNRALSMGCNQLQPIHNHRRNFLTIFESLSFYRLEKRHQCMAYTALNGDVPLGGWIFPKKEASNQTQVATLVEKLCDIFDCGESNAKEWLRLGLYTPEEIDRGHKFLYDRESLITKNGKASKK